jgi:3'(2'), 5'-bisphosphate nucleotidase
VQYEKELQEGLKAVAQASAMCAAIQSNLNRAMAIDKTDRSPVTIADFGSQALIIAALQRYFNNDAIIAEEDAEMLASSPHLMQQVLDWVRRYRPVPDEGQLLDWLQSGSVHDASERFWTLDPIDGTKGFLSGNHYAVALALVVDGQVVMAALGCPRYPLDGPVGQTAGDVAEGCLFYALHGQGAFKQSLAGGNRKQIQVNPHFESASARFCESRVPAHADHQYHAELAHRLGIGQEPCRIDSQAKYAAVAQGDAVLYLRRSRDVSYREKIWDHAAGALIVEEAGGRVSDLKGRPLDFSRGAVLEANEGVLVSNGHWHADALAAVNAMAQT